MSRREIGYVVVIVVLVAAVAFFFLQDTLISGSQNQAVGMVTDVYGLITESDVEVLSVEEMSGMYKLLLRLKGPQGDTLQEIYVSQDGSLITDKIIITEDYKTSLENQKAFVECLQEKQVLIFGQSNEPNTIQQLQVLGNFAYKIYVDCLGAQLEACQQFGIQAIPSVVYEGKIYQGTQNIEWFESLTGCEF